MTRDPVRRDGAEKEEGSMFGKRNPPHLSTGKEATEDAQAAKPGVTAGAKTRAGADGVSGRSKAVSPTPYETPRRVSDYTLPAARGDFRTNRGGGGGEGRKLVVGRDISLAGEIKSCELLIVEGLVEADLKGCQLLQISETGVFKGSAEVAQAEISGRFEGDLVITDRLLLRSTGSIVGSLRYNEMEIERGGKISGSIEDRVQATGAPKKAADRPAASAEAVPLPRPPLARGKAPEKTTT